MKYQAGQASLHMILTIFLGFGMVLFGILAVVAYSDSNKIHATLDQRLKTATEDATKKQKAVDAEAYRKAAELPFRAYIAGVVDGGFTLQVPKDWSIYAQHGQLNAAVQLDLMINPANVDFNVGGVNTLAFHLKIVKMQLPDVVKTYDEKIKKKQVAGSGITVSGISATKLEGTIDDQRHNGVVILFPIRDKTMIISTDSHNYITEFNQIVATAHIIP